MYGLHNINNMRAVHQCYNDFLKINLGTCVSIRMCEVWYGRTGTYISLELLIHKQCNDKIYFVT